MKRNRPRTQSGPVWYATLDVGAINQFSEVRQRGAV
jgi:hypothetical protein